MVLLSKISELILAHSSPSLPRSPFLNGGLWPLEAKWRPHYVVFILKIKRLHTIKFIATFVKKNLLLCNVVLTQKFVLSSHRNSNQVLIFSPTFFNKTLS